MIPGQAGLQRLCRVGPIRIDLWPGRGALVLAFSSIGHDPARPPSPEFLRTATASGRAALFITDESRSWANAPEFDIALRQGFAMARACCDFDRVVSLGLSMGGFAALVAGTVLPVDATLAIGAQFSVDPAVMPGETRWRPWTARLTAFRHVTAPLPPGWNVLLHGLADDRHQALAFPQCNGTDQLLYDDLSHAALGPHLKARGGLQGLLDALVAQDRRRLLRIAAAGGGQRRRPGQLPR